VKLMHVQFTCMRPTCMVVSCSLFNEIDLLRINGNIDLL